MDYKWHIIGGFIVIKVVDDENDLLYFVVFKSEGLLPLLLGNFFGFVQDGYGLLSVKLKNLH